MALEVTDAPLHRMSLADFERALGAGVYGGEDRLELLDGLVVVRVSPGNTHQEAVQRLLTWMVRSLDVDGTRMHVQSPLRLWPDARPEPDLFLVPPGSTGIAQSADLVIEVSVSTRRVDLGAKRGIYARSAIPVYWVVQPEQQLIRVHEDPRDGDYSAVTDVHVATFEGAEFDVRTLPVLPEDG